MKFAAVQVSSQADVAHNLSAARREVERAKSAGADVVVLPEGFAFLGPEAEKRLIAETLGEDPALDGPIVAELRAWSRQYDVVVIGAGLPELSPDAARPFNTSAVFRRGQLLARYRKMHLFDVDLTDGTRLCESAATSPGDEPAVVELDGVRVGLSICYDLRFPEFFLRQRQRGVDVLALGAAFTRTTGQAHWHILLRARAIETQCYVVAAAQYGEHPRGRKTFGHSLIIDPWGEVLADLAEGPGFVMSEVDLDRIRSIRAQMPIEQHRHPELSRLGA
jgi:deaminated glutathione amidase